MTEDKKFNHIKIELPPKLKRVNVDGKRRYMTPEGLLYKSVTSVLSIVDKEGIDKWRAEVGEDVADTISFRATSTGLQMHKIIEKYLTNQDYSEEKRLLPRAHFENIKEHINKIDNIYGSEITLYSDKLKLAGTADCIGEYDGVKSIIDFKTSSRKKEEEWIKKYYLQETAYSVCFEERCNMKINQIVTIISSETGENDVFIRDRDTYIDELIKIVEAENK
jgi:genome maintenance exonuclease 1